MDYELLMLGTMDILYLTATAADVSKVQVLAVVLEAVVLILSSHKAQSTFNLISGYFNKIKKDSNF